MAITSLQIFNCGGRFAAGRIFLGCLGIRRDTRQPLVPMLAPFMYQIPRRVGSVITGQLISPTPSFSAAIDAPPANYSPSVSRPARSGDAILLFLPIPPVVLAAAAQISGGCSISGPPSPRPPPPPTQPDPSRTHPAPPAPPSSNQPRIRR